MGPICDLWLWVCWCCCVGALVVVVPHFYLFILFVIGDFVWSRLRKKTGDLASSFFPPIVD